MIRRIVASGADFSRPFPLSNKTGTGLPDKKPEAVCLRLFVFLYYRLYQRISLASSRRSKESLSV